MERISFIPCLTWVQQGKSKAHIEKVKHTKEELKEIVKELKLKEAEYESRPNNDPKPPVQPPDPSDQEEEDEISKLYGMDNYDDEDGDVLGDGGSLGTSGYGIENLILNNSSESESEDTDADDEEFSVKPDDNLILMGHVESDVCMLEVYVFNNTKAELFILHDIFLPSYPICIEWLDYNPKESENRGNFAAVGGMTSEINVWDLNVSGCLEAAFQLGGKKTKKPQRHTDAILDLSWCPENRNVLASASADKSVLLWDMSQLTSVLRLSHFEDKVQAAKFHPRESHSLLTGGCDGKVRLYDCRAPTNFKTWEFSGEIERVLWNHFEPNNYFASTEKGFVYQVDTRMDQPLWTLKAHAVEVTGLALSSHCKDLLLTGGMDEAVKVWDLKDNKPQFVTEKAMHVGQILTLSCCPSVPYVFCAGGNKKDNYMYLWDIRENDAVLQQFRDRSIEATSSDSNPGEYESMSQDPAEPRPCSSSSLQTRNNQSRFEGALKKHRSKGNKELRAMHQEERGQEAESAAAERRKQKEKERKKLRKEHKKLHPKSKDKDKS